MSEAVLLKLLDFGLTAAAIGLERQAVMDKANAMIAAGKTPDEVAEALVQMRDEAIAKAKESLR